MIWRVAVRQMCENSFKMELRQGLDLRDERVGLIGIDPRASKPGVDLHVHVDRRFRAGSGLSEAPALAASVMFKRMFSFSDLTASVSESCSVATNGASTSIAGNSHRSRSIASSRE